MICNFLLEYFLVNFLRPLFDVLSQLSVSFILVPNFALSEFLTQTSGLFGSSIMLVVGLVLPTVLPGARTSYNPSKFYFLICVDFLCIFDLNTAFATRGWSRYSFPPHEPRFAILHFFLFLVGSNVRCTNHVLYFCVRTQGCVCPLFFCQISPARNCIFIQIMFNYFIIV